MGFIQAISDFFGSFFKKSSPESQKKQQLKKLDQELKEYQPLICKNGFLQANFGEALYTLYRYTKPLYDLFSQTVTPNDMSRQHRFEAQLILTGYSPEFQNIIESLSFENRKQEVLSEKYNVERVYIHHKSQLEKVIKELNTDLFKKMDADILLLRRFVEFCGYNFVTFLQLFDSSFMPSNLSYTPTYKEVSVQKAQNLLEDLYYHIADLSINMTMANEILALAQLRKGSELSENEIQNIMGCLKKINYVLKKVLTDYILKVLIRYGKEDLTYEPEKAVYSGSPRQEFAQILQTRFEAEEKRIKSEIQDEQISEELTALFDNIPLENVYGYDVEHNNLLQKETSLSLMWVLPFRILKTFIKNYVPSSLRTLLNDIIIEGFFNNSTYKTNFSTVVFSVSNSDALIEEFEGTFRAGQRNNIAILESYVEDSKKDKDFFTKLEKMVFQINNDAHKILQTEVSHLHVLYKFLEELLADAKKPSGEIVSNLKILMISSRNRDNTMFLEQKINKWKIFFDIMKNYVIINNDVEIHS